MVLRYGKKREPVSPSSGGCARRGGAPWRGRFPPQREFSGTPENSTLTTWQSHVVRVERRGKSSPVAWRHADAVNSIRSNTVDGDTKAGPAVPRRWLEPVGNGGTQIDGRLRQNPAYRPARKMIKGSRPSIARPRSFLLRVALTPRRCFPSCARRSARRRSPRTGPASSAYS